VSNAVRILAVAVIFLVAVAGPEKVTPQGKDDALKIVVPAHRGRVSSSWVTLIVTLPPELERVPLKVTLDGKDVTDPLAVRRRQKAVRGTGFEYIAHWGSLNPQ
jgi:hypothetical protein